MSFLVNKVPKNPNHVGTQWQVQYPKFCTYAGLTNSLEQSFKYKSIKKKNNQTHHNWLVSEILKKSFTFYQNPNIKTVREIEKQNC